MLPEIFLEKLFTYIQTYCIMELKQRENQQGGFKMARMKKMTFVDIETGKRVDSGKWSYIVWDTNYEEIARDGGFGTEDEAYEDACEYMDYMYGKGKWAC